ncbi:electron transport complex subunit RsxC [Kangiella sp. HZ709]|uniref:electron transport complex subunit RsxC n=1 Tax=Kangiella sp. HZ709 TaxID=2666328 RepID=UPI0012B06E4D|nr:electron transport complex subunit RsxC [Kangiella sp. HZ709]MRX27142.1 electron transport complex subunit RsxC [Kangiella sp. HZ709]
MERSSYPSEIPIFEFPGGIHPQENKQLSNRSPIAKLPLAKELVINLKGQAGNRSIPCVAVGEQVLKGQLIAKSDGIFSSYQHAPTSGKIIAIEKRPIAHTSGLEDLCIVLSADGDERWVELSPAEDFTALCRKQILARIFESGIVGLGGASFPSHIKLQREDGIDTLIINAAECEPYISCDDRLLQDNTDEVLKGAQIISHLYKDLNIIVGIEDNKPSAIEALKAARTKLRMTFDIAVVPTKYPSGGEKQLIQLIAGKEVTHGKLPADLGLVMHNVATCFAIYEAIIQDKPITDRVVTLTGKACGKPGNYRIPIGTPIKHLLESTQTLKSQKLIMGGPMMGFEIQSINAGIVKATNCIIMADSNELKPEQTSLPCIRCGECMNACPASLLPQQLYWHAKADEFDKTEEYNLFDCIECGACAYVCPSDIPLVQFYRYAKSNIRNNRVEKIKADNARERHEARLDRIERVKLEKAEKHRKAAEARRKAAEASGQADAKKAAVAAALARVQAKKEANHEASNSHQADKTKEPKA